VASSHDIFRSERRFKWKKQLLHLAIASALATGVASDAAGQVDQGMLKNYEDDTSITLSGHVIEARSDEFDLRVDNDDTVTVEVDEQFRDGGAFTLIAGDQVTVSGLVDEDFFEGRELEANALYIEKIGATFILDEDHVEKYGMTPGRTLVDTIEVAGNVTRVGDDADEFRIHTSAGDFTVEVDELMANPIDDEGVMQIRPGDWVNVAGHIDSDWLEGREIVASRVNVLRVDLDVD
jgi:uncharacterized protein YdeI (BOF family)